MVAPKLKGTRPRPRVAVVGPIEQGSVDTLHSLFPTLWVAGTFVDLDRLVDHRELDLVVIGRNVSKLSQWLDDVNVICFSSSELYLPGPHPGDWVSIAGLAPTETFVLPELPLPDHRLREDSLVDIQSAKGWPILTLSHGQQTSVEEDTEAKRIFTDGAIALDPYSERPFATAFVRPQSGLGMAWLPIESLSLVRWVELLCMKWSVSNEAAFPNFANWLRLPEWMTARERELEAKVAMLEYEKTQAMERAAKAIADASHELREAGLDANRGIRRLITAQGDDLVDEVANAFSRIGFEVSRVDENLARGQPRVEDLRLRDPDSKWEAVVEVRGYSRSGGTTADLLRLARFARIYEEDRGIPPSKRIYVVNGQIELPPNQRTAPLSSTRSDLEEFSVQGGLVIWTIDLFRHLEASEKSDTHKIRMSIMEASGRWQAASPDSSAA